MDFDEWQARTEAATHLSGHGSRKRIAEVLGMTSETIKAGEKSGKATPKMVRKLDEFIGGRQARKFEQIHGRGGRWNSSRCFGGAYVTHVTRPFAFTALFQDPDPAVGTTARDMMVYVTPYDEMSDGQLEDLIDEAREIAARILNLPKESECTGIVASRKLGAAVDEQKERLGMVEPEKKSSRKRKRRPACRRSPRSGF